jgi:hypothetical protein
MAGKKASRKSGKSGGGTAGQGPKVLFQRALIEASFIIFLFYSNLLMGEYTRSNAPAGKTLASALTDVFTAANFVIAVVTSLIGYVVVEYLRTTL